MNFDFSDDQHAIKRTASELLAERFKPEKVRELAEDGRYDDDVWREVCELGWPGIFIEEAHGGQGLGVVELIILMEELGYALAPLPFLSNAAAGLVIQAAGGDEQKERWLPGIASGEARGTVAVMRERDGGNEAPLVPDADSAELIVVIPCEGPPALVEASAADVEPLETIDDTRRYARVRAEGGDALEGNGEAGVHAMPVAVAAELTGVAQHALEMAVDYAREREQFGRKIGAYQAVSHRCAQMMMETESARSTTYYAAWTADAEPESLPLAASMAKAYASDAGWRVTAAALQIFGGIGFTWEHDLHFFLKRARVNGTLYGTAREHRDAVAQLAGLAREPAPA
jgi:alkylation response protein AidB-like acyl-CoA dehydrogenase